MLTAESFAVKNPDLLWIVAALVSCVAMVLFAVAGEWVGVLACLMLFALSAAACMRK